MIARLKTYLLYGKYFCGVEHTSEHGEEKLYVSVLKKSKNAIDIDSAFQAASLDVLKTKLSKGQHVSLIINNDNILTKRLESEPLEAEKLVYKAFPNINLEDFYYETITQKGTHFIAICRKAYLDELIAEYRTCGVAVINIALGNLAASSLSRFVNRSTLLTSNAKISFDSETTTAIERTDTKANETYNINGLSVNNDYLLSLTGALDTVLHHFESTTSFKHLKQSFISDYTQAKFFSLFFKFGMVFILAILLINFVVFNHYYNRVNTLQQTSQINQTTKQKLLKLDEAVNKSQKMVDDMLKSSSSKSSFYANALVQSIPQSIVLSELNYQPLEKTIRKDKVILLKNNTMVVSGASSNSDAFSKWIAHLESMAWINTIDILSYEDGTKAVSDFSIKLNMGYD